MAWIVTIMWWSAMFAIAQTWPIIGGLLIAWTLIDWFYQLVTNDR